MNVQFFEDYFSSYSTMIDASKSQSERTRAKVCFASYFLLGIPPMIIGIGYAIASACNCLSKIGKSATLSPSDASTEKKTQDKANACFIQRSKVGQISPKGNQQQIPMFVEVLNTGTYTINNTKIAVPAATKPIAFRKTRATLEAELKYISENMVVAKPISYQFVNRSTEEAISASNSFRIAVNFANEDHAGGGPGIHRNPNPNDPQKFIYDGPSARAQEESICQKSTLFDSLTQLDHVAERGNHHRHMRSFYLQPSPQEPNNLIKKGFDSKETAYVSDNHLFAVQGATFYESRYLNEPKAVSFITSAANYYGPSTQADCGKNSANRLDARQRIETHLLAAASRAKQAKAQNPNQPVELILGAFGCGAFAPANADAYRTMIAEIYVELLPKFDGIFDTVTFAVPTFDKEKTDPQDPAVLNHQAFKKDLKALVK